MSQRQRFHRSNARLERRRRTRCRLPRHAAARGGSVAQPAAAGHAALLQEPMRTIAFTARVVFLVAARAAALQVLTPLPQTVVRAGTVVTVPVGPSAGEVLIGPSAATSEQTVEATAGTQPGTFDLQIQVPTRAVGPTFVF